MKREITAEFAEDIGLIPKVGFYINTGRFLFWRMNREKTEREYAGDLSNRNRQYSVDGNNMVEFEEDDIYKKVDLIPRHETNLAKPLPQKGGERGN